MAPRLLRQGASDQFVCEAAFESGGTSKISCGRWKSRMNVAANPTIDTDRWGRASPASQRPVIVIVSLHERLAVPVLA